MQSERFFIIGDYADTIKTDYLPWVSSVVEIVNDIKAKHGDRVEVRIADEPYFLAFMLYELVQKWWLFLISFLIVAAMLWKLNNGWRGALFPLIGVLSTILITLGLMGFSQYKLTTMMVLTPMLLLAIGTGHVVQVVRRYLNELHIKEMTPIHAAQNAITTTIVPVTLAIITDMVGFFTLSFVDISFYKAYAYFGMFGMFGMMTILFITTTIAPILMATFCSKDLVKDKEKYLCQNSKFETVMANSLTNVVTTKLKIIPIALVAALLTWSAIQTKIFMSTDKTLMPGLER